MQQMENVDALMLQSTFPVQALAAAMALLTAPLIADLAVGIAGNLRRPRMPRTPRAGAVRLAVVVPAHDEEPVIARTVRSLLAAGCSAYASRAAGGSASPGDVPVCHPGGVDVSLETPVFVVAHNCSDATAAAAAAAGARVIELNPHALHGKGAALRAGFEAARAASANAFLVVDADSVASPNLIAATRAALQAGAAATQCRYELELPASGLIRSADRLRVLAFRGINVLRARGRAGLGFSAGIFGNGFALTAGALESAPFSVNSICEDLEYHVRLVCAGLRVDWLEDAFVHAPLARTRSAQAAQEARWEGGRFHVATRATGRLLAAVFHGNWRALEVLAETWSLPLSRGVLALLLTAFLPLHWLHIFTIACAVVVLLYVLEAVLLGAEPWRDLAALVNAPVHILWKLAITPLVLRQSRNGAEWARTRREAQLP
jgi:hypothetical protein